MSYGFYLQDITCFDDLADWLEDHIRETGESLNLGKAPRTLKSDIKKFMKETLKDEIIEYGWTGNEELPGVASVNMFHTVFAEFNKNLYAAWFRMNHEEFEPESPFAYDTLNKAFDEITKQFEEDGVALTKKLLIQEMKRGLHVKLFSMMQSIDYTLEHEANIASIKYDGLRPTNEVADELEEIMLQTLKLERQLYTLIRSIERLDYSTTISFGCLSLPEKCQDL